MGPGILNNRFEDRVHVMGTISRHVPLDSTADRSGTPTSKSVVVRLEPALD